MWRQSERPNLCRCSQLSRTASAVLSLTSKHDVRLGTDGLQSPWRSARPSCVHDKSIRELSNRASTRVLSHPNTAQIYTFIFEIQSTSMTCTTVFDIHFLQEAICYDLTARDIRRCMLVCRSWYANFSAYLSNKCLRMLRRNSTGREESPWGWHGLWTNRRRGKEIE